MATPDFFDSVLERMKKLAISEKNSSLSQEQKTTKSALIKEIDRIIGVALDQSGNIDSEFIDRLNKLIDDVIAIQEQ
jgi:pantothenate synthetase